jgi:hypothetical protein
LERLQAGAGAGYVIGQDRDRDRKRRQELRRLKLSPGLTKADAAELAALDASFENEDRDIRRKSELFYRERFRLGGPALTDAERIEYAELRERYPPNLNGPYKELCARLRAIADNTSVDGARNKVESERERTPAEAEECVTSEANRAAATGRSTPNVAEKLKPASPDLMTDAEQMPDEHNTRKARSEFELAELVGRIGNLYTKKGLSPPFILRDAVTSWGGLSQEEIVAVIEKHFQDCRQFYIAGAGDGHFHTVRSAISKALEAKYPRDRLGEVPEPPRRRRPGQIR